MGTLPSDGFGWPLQPPRRPGAAPTPLAALGCGATASLLEGGLAVVREEKATVQWFAVRFDASTFGIFDTFADDAGRQAHLSGQIASALMAAVGDLVEAPVIEPVDVLARKG